MNTKSKITYRTVGDYLIPNITIPVNDDLIPLAKWGMAHKEYLMNNKRVLFIIMLTK